ncbi:MAG: ATP-binding cassette domain-containing protein, partial [Planctomycetota bacterium]
MSLVIAENVTQLYGAQEVLRDVSFRIGQSDSIGLVGANGEGKTTLLRIMAGLLAPTGGQVHRAKGLRAGYLPQEPPAPEGGTLQGLALDAFAEARRAEEHMLQLSALMGGEDDGGDLLREYAEAERRFEALGGYSYHNRVERVLTGLGFERDTWDKPLSEFSGGQLTRAYLARLLLEEPDLLLLDEPTNHLDMGSIELLEGWLRTFRKAMIAVSHDRYFLDSVTKRTWEVASGAL